MLKRISQEKINSLLLAVVAVLILLNSLSMFRNSRIIVYNNELKEQITLTKQTTSSILTRIVQATDVATRGYAITEDQAFVKAFDFLYLKQENIYVELIISLDSLQADLSGIRRLERATLSYIDFSRQMIGEIERGNTEKFKSMLAEDRGGQLYELYVSVSEDIFTHTDQLEKEATSHYTRALKWNRWLQIALLVTSIPTIVSVILRMSRETKGREGLYRKLADNNRKYLFDSGRRANDGQNNSLEAVLTTSIENMQKASSFINQTAEGNLDVEWDGLNEENKSLNSTTLAGALMRMREQMARVKDQNERRLWATEGTAQVVEIVRTHQSDVQQMAEALLAHLIKYLDANQGAFFFEEVGEKQRACLSMVACYAYGKKKHTNKTVEIGQGLVGQTYLEKKVTLITQVPNNYSTITSGLGEATPSTLLLLPLMFNEEVVGILEIASFGHFLEHQISFLESVAEVIASAAITTRMNAQTKVLLAQAQEDTEKLRAQEEEMRQNMEELQATQEEMARKMRQYEAGADEQQRTAAS